MNSLIYFLSFLQTGEQNSGIRMLWNMMLPVSPRTSIFYCDPMRSCQKAGIENVHTMLRMILPKGTVFEGLTQWDVRKCVDHINNAPRKKLNGRTPYGLAVKALGPDILKKMQLRYVEPDKVTLSPKLLSNL